MEAPIPIFLIPVTKKYFDFSSRATRSEYWLFTLFLLALSLAAILTATFFIGNFADAAITMVPFMQLLELFLFIPYLAVTVRRLHDIDKSAWWFLIILIPFIGIIWFYVLMCLSGLDGDNRFRKEAVA